MGAWGGRQTRAKNLRYLRVPRELALFLAKPELARSCCAECARCQRYDFFLGFVLALDAASAAPLLYYFL